jgi:hypothetical protein
MRLLIFASVFIFITSCSSDVEPVQRLFDYEYPLDSLDQGKIFVYKRSPPGEFYFVEQKRLKQDGTEYILQETYDTKERVSSEKYLITETGKELVESYLYFYSDSLSKNFKKKRGEIVSYKNKLDGKKFPGIYIELHIVPEVYYKGESIFTETFKKEDKLLIGDNMLDVVIFDTEIDIHGSARIIPLFSSRSVYIGENIYAKKLGLVKYWTKMDDERFDWELVEIKNID